jgi:hypothetical protein
MYSLTNLYFLQFNFSMIYNQKQPATNAVMTLLITLIITYQHLKKLCDMTLFK